MLTIDRVLADRATDWSRESMPRVEICAVSSAVENDSSAARRTSSLRLTCSVTSMANLMTLIIRPRTVLDRVVGGFNMCPLAGGAAALENARGRNSPCRSRAQKSGFSRIELVEAEHAVVLALERLEAVAEETQKVLVGIEYLAVRGELDDRHGLAYGVVDRVEQEQFGMVAGHVGGDLQHLDDRPSAFFTGK